ncbi:NUDIX domain-containing protein [Candidatus Marsarchaeota archaeon]|nr:NUDIX domain-containing protein [Candidatus Marsarchaeota archaeon]
MRFEYSAGIMLYKKSSQKVKFLLLLRIFLCTSLPKGHIEKGENAMEAALRETYEETGIRATPDKYFSFSTYYWFVDEGEKVKKYIKIFIADADGASVRISKEHSSYIWADAAEAIEMYKSHKFNTSYIEEAAAYVEKLSMLSELNSIYAELPNVSKAWDLSRNFVKGEGPANAKIMVIGQAPGNNEDKSGRPFVGKAGQLLDQLLSDAGIKRQEVYITSVVQFMPPKNRAPTGREIDMCKPFLFNQISIIKPKLLVLLGSVAAQTLCGVKEVMKEHGNIIKAAEMSYFITLHPAAAVRIRKNLPIIKGDFKKLGAYVKSEIDSKP